ncbi:3-deoxy-D-manno-octulosonic acid transferase [Roseovarius sp. LXJ103]|uniref:3-deoxy-D-manno-octulosonic acid transferase n=1 Tax=Roseovarius carneus TaxID=2853164 RepID=UPI000D605DD2|nr:3-deoxy-D-manno-octulosonic acid transferase [Roseovarius carneus]MBZ8119659.1 3-deoxy-D-manno-octulosonic acid transferase [Roseovarius carneus]PWE34726.1 3-deoxy-D-manno-octulosonic acid transferase [Pelagicola sp. LXJ1103]
MSALARPTLLLRIYGGLATALAPLAYTRIKTKLRSHSIDPERFSERMGHPGLPRPAGRLIWFHAASVGESLSVLRLIEEMGSALPDVHFLLTSGTATSAEIVARRLPTRTQHQFAPLDSARAMARFLNHWRPDAGVFVESELWPNMLRSAAARGVPLALINARISDRSARNWTRAAGTARSLMGLFRMIHTQDARTERHLRGLGLKHAKMGQNLKSFAAPLPVDENALSAMQGGLSHRPLWVFSSSHPGEEEIALRAHAALLAAHPDLLLILVPRHPERGGNIARLIADRGMQTARRSLGAMPGAEEAVFLADTLGETGLWYRLSPIVCLGGSFTPVGGHNPYEPAHCGAAILHGPLYANFIGVYAELHRAKAAMEVQDAGALAQAVGRLLSSADALKNLQSASTSFAAIQADALGHMARDLCAALELAPPP